MATKRKLNCVGWYQSPYALLPVLCKGILDLLEPRRKLKVLDIACGPSGTSTLSIFNHCKAKNIEITSIDVNPESCTKFCKTLRDGGYQDRKIKVKRMDATKLDFSNESFDLVTGVGALSNIDTPERAIQEATRVLKADGQLLLGDFFLPKNAKELWRQLSALGYGRPRPYMDYHDLIRFLHNSDLNISSFKPIRWIFNYENFWKNFENEKRNIAKTLFCNVPAWIKKEIELHKRADGAQAMVYNSFVLSAKKVGSHQIIKKDKTDAKLNMRSININKVWEVWD